MPQRKSVEADLFSWTGIGGPRDSGKIEVAGAAGGIGPKGVQSGVYRYREFPSGMGVGFDGKVVEVVVVDMGEGSELCMGEILVGITGSTISDISGQGRVKVSGELHDGRD